jgi:hypothetical protein
LRDKPHRQKPIARNQQLRPRYSFAATTAVAIVSTGNDAKRRVYSA